MAKRRSSFGQRLRDLARLGDGEDFAVAELQVENERLLDGHGQRGRAVGEQRVLFDQLARARAVLLLQRVQLRGRERAAL